jgi:hypothetical protein
VENFPWADVTVGVAAIGGLIYVARTLRGTVKEQLTFLYNHLSENTKAQVETARSLQAVAGALEDVATTVKDLTEDGRRAHEEARSRQSTRR